MLAYSAYKGYKDHKNKKPQDEATAEPTTNEAHGVPHQTQHAPPPPQQQQYGTASSTHHHAPQYTNEIQPAAAQQPSLEARWQNLEARVSALEARDALRQ